MLIKRGKAILRGLAEFWKNEELQDFTVTVGNAHFGCHRLLLASCSDYFRGLFRSGMQETTQKSVCIQGIASETFDFILESLYTGLAVLTDDNVIDIWRAADQLQIHFLVSKCENFVLNTMSMENCADYFYVSNTLNSTTVLEALWTFLAKNCHSFFETSYFVQMPMADVLRLVKSQELETKSEDDVIWAILKWAEFQKVKRNDAKYLDKKDKTEKNEVRDEYSPCRKKSKKCTGGSTSSSKLDTHSKRDAYEKKDNQRNVIRRDITILLSNARTYLVSQQCLEMLVGHPLVRDNKEAIDIVNDALLYQRKGGKGNGLWPSKAVHRNHSSILHCIVTAVKRGNCFLFSAFSVARQKWYPISYSKHHKTIQLAVVNNKLYAFGIYQFESGLRHRSTVINLHIWQPTKSKTTAILRFHSDDLCVAVVGSFVYLFSAQKQTIVRIKVRNLDISKSIKLQGPEPIAHLMVYEKIILVFHASTEEIVGQTIVRCYDTSRNSWTEQKNIEGPANGMTSFRDDHFTYLLQSNGNLWKVVRPNANIIDFEIVAKLWSSDVPLQGAVTYLGDLYIGIQPTADLTNHPQLPRSLPGLFRAIIYLEIASDEIALFTPMLLSENDFHKDKFPSPIVNQFTDLL